MFLLLSIRCTYLELFSRRGQRLFVRHILRRHYTDRLYLSHFLIYFNKCMFGRRDRQHHDRDDVACLGTSSSGRDRSNYTGRATWTCSSTTISRRSQCHVRLIHVTSNSLLHCGRLNSHLPLQSTCLSTRQRSVQSALDVQSWTTGNSARGTSTGSIGGRKDGSNSDSCGHSAICCCCCTTDFRIRQCHDVGIVSERWCGLDAGRASAVGSDVV